MKKPSHNIPEFKAGNLVLEVSNLKIYNIFVFSDLTM